MTSFIGSAIESILNINVVQRLARGAITLYLKDLFENVATQNFEELSLSRERKTLVHLKDLHIKKQLLDNATKNSPIKVLHAGVGRLKAELTLNTKKPRKMVLEQVNIVVEFDPDWKPAVIPQVEIPSIATGISGATKIIIGSQTTSNNSDGSGGGQQQAVTDDGMSEELKEIIMKARQKARESNASSSQGNENDSSNNTNEDAADKTAEALTVLLMQLVHHSELTVDGLWIRVRFKPSAKNNASPKATTNEILICIPSIHVQDHTDFSGGLSDAFKKFVSIAPPLVQVRALFEDEVNGDLSTIGVEDLDPTDTVAMGDGFLKARLKLFQALHPKDAKTSDSKSSDNNKTNENAASSPAQQATTEGFSSSSSSDDDSQQEQQQEEHEHHHENKLLDFNNVMKETRCVTISLHRRNQDPSNPRLPLWNVDVKTTPLMMCFSPLQIELLLDIGYRVGQQSKLQSQVEEERVALGISTASSGSSVQAAAATTTTTSSNKKHHENDKNSSSTSTSTTTKQQMIIQVKKPPPTFSVSLKVDHSVIAIYTIKNRESYFDLWSAIEQDGSLAPQQQISSSSSFSSFAKPHEKSLPKCLSSQFGFFALSLGHGQIFVEKNLSKNICATTIFSNDKSTTTTSSSSSNINKGIQYRIEGETDYEKFLDQFTEITFKASLASLSFVDCGSENKEIDAVNIIEFGLFDDDEDSNDNDNDNDNEDDSSSMLPERGDAAAGEIIVKLAQPVLFHDILRRGSESYSNCINLSGVRQRHPTTDEKYSHALVKSTVAAKDISVKTTRRALVRLEPTMLCRFVDFGNKVTDMILKAKELNGVCSDENENENNNSAEETSPSMKKKKKKKETSSSSTSTPNYDFNQPFSESVTTFSLCFQQVDLQCLVHKHRPPDPTLYGPLTIRLFDFLASKLSFSSSHLLCRSLLVRAKECRFSATPGSEPLNALLTISSATAMVQDEEEVEVENENEQQETSTSNDNVNIETSSSTFKINRRPLFEIRPSYAASIVSLEQHHQRLFQNLVHEQLKHQQQTTSTSSNSTSSSNIQASPTTSLPPTQLSLFITSKSNPISINSDLDSKLDGIASRLAKLPTEDQKFLSHGKLSSQLASTAVDIYIPTVTGGNTNTNNTNNNQKENNNNFVGGGDILMDDFLFLLFATAELAEIPLPLQKLKVLQQEQEQENNNNNNNNNNQGFIPNTIVAVNLKLHDIKGIVIAAPRLDQHGIFLGDPLFFTLNSQKNNKNKNKNENFQFAVHRYELRASQLTLTLGIGTKDSPLTQHWGMTLGLGGFSLSEIEIVEFSRSRTRRNNHQFEYIVEKTKKKILCDSFAEAYQRSHSQPHQNTNITATENTTTATSQSATTSTSNKNTNNSNLLRTGRVLNIILIRDTCFNKRTDVMRVEVIVECVSLVQHASFEGDAWPAVLAAWAADSPLEVKAGEKIHSTGKIQQQDVIPLSSSIDAKVIARDLLLDWQPERRRERFAVLVSAIDVEVLGVVTGNPKLTVSIQVPAPAALLLHNDFPTPIIDYDRRMYEKNVIIFGRTQEGVLADMKNLGFAQMCVIGPNIHNTNTNKMNQQQNSSSQQHNTTNNNIPTIIVKKSHPSSNRKLQIEIHSFFIEFAFAPDSCCIFQDVLEHCQDEDYVKKSVTSPVKLVRLAGGSFRHVNPSILPVQIAPSRAFVQDFDLVDDASNLPGGGKRNTNNTNSNMTMMARNSSTTSITSSVSPATATSRNFRQQQQLKSSSKKFQSFDEDEWDMLEEQHIPQVGPDSFTLFTENPISLSSPEELEQFQFLLKEQEKLQKQQQRKPQQTKKKQQHQNQNAEDGKELKENENENNNGNILTQKLMTELDYFKVPIFEEARIAEPLFNVPDTIEFELLLHSCDFKFSLFNGSDFVMMNENFNNKNTENTSSSSGSSGSPNSSSIFGASSGNNNNPATNDYASRKTLKNVVSDNSIFTSTSDESVNSSVNNSSVNWGNQNNAAAASATSRNYHYSRNALFNNNQGNTTTSIRMFDIHEQRPRTRLARNERESVAFWITGCFVQLDLFPSIEVSTSDDDDDDDDDEDNENEISSSSATAAAATSSRHVDPNDSDISNSSNSTPSKRNKTTKNQLKQQQQQQNQSWTTTRQLIVKAGDIEIEDLLQDKHHECRKLLYCSVPKTKRDGAVLTFRLRTLKKQVIQGNNSPNQKEPEQQQENDDDNESSALQSQQQEQFFSHIIQSHQTSIRILPLGVNIAAKTVIRVFVPFVGALTFSLKDEKDDENSKDENNDDEFSTTPKSSTRSFVNNSQQLLPPDSTASLMSVAAQAGPHLLPGSTSLTTSRPLDSVSNLESPINSNDNININDNSQTMFYSAAGSQQSFTTSTSATNLQNNNNNILHQQQQNISTNETSASSAPPIFFDKIIIHPLDITVSWYPDDSLNEEQIVEAMHTHLSDLLGSSKVATFLHYSYIIRYLAISRAPMNLSRIHLNNVNLEDVAQSLVVEAWPQLTASKLLFLIAGLQPLKPVGQVAEAIGDLVLTPLEFWEHDRSIFVGITKGIALCTSKLTSETLSLAATTTRAAQNIALNATSGIRPQNTKSAQPMLWGDQPQGFAEGATRAVTSVGRSILDFGSAVVFSLDEMKRSSTAPRGVVHLPLSALIPVEGVLRGLTEAILGVRNTIRPEAGQRDRQEFKSTIFSHRDESG